MWVLIQGQSSNVMRKDQIRGQGQMLKVSHTRTTQAWARFVHFGALKIHLLLSLETHVLVYFLASCDLILFILAAWKCNFCLVLKPMLQKFVASCEHIFYFMATWKYDSFISWSCEKTKFAARVKGHGQTRITHRESSLREFWRPENTFTAESWFLGTYHASRVRSFVWTHFLLYGDLKIW